MTTGDVLAIAISNELAAIIYAGFASATKMKSLYFWLGTFIVSFPQAEAINNPSERSWPILGIVLGIPGIILIARETYLIGKRRGLAGRGNR